MNKPMRFAIVVTAGLLVSLPRATLAQRKLSPEMVRGKIAKAHVWLKARQNADGSFTYGAGGHTVGATGLALLAMMNSGLTPKDPAVARGLKYLRGLRGTPDGTYDASLMLMALAAAHDGTDARLKADLVDMLEGGQKKAGKSAGGWSYKCRGEFRLNRPDRSNSQFAVLALRDAALDGVKVKKSTWQLIKQYWETGQSIDGGWGYVSIGGSTGTMTVAGVASLSIVRRMLEVKPDLDCCGKPKPYLALEKGITWLNRRIKSIGSPPGRSRNVMYWLYGLERAGRLTGRRFFAGKDWYRDGVEFLTIKGNPQNRSGYWVGSGFGESDPVVATSMALLFLSKGLAPVLINKLKYGPTKAGARDEVASDNWNRHPQDTRNLTEYVSGLQGWPKLLTWQTVEMPKILRYSKTIDEAVISLEQAKVLMISGRDAPKALYEDGRQIQILKRFIDRGGFVLLVGNCKPDAEFDDGVKELVKKIFTVKHKEGGIVEQIAKLEPLTKDHAVYRSEYNLTDSVKELPIQGVQYGCRTALMYVPVRDDGWDMACLWNKWTRYGREKLGAKHTKWMTLAMKAGTNILAYATGRRPPQKLAESDTKKRGKAGDIKRGLLQVAKLKHTGDHNVAPRALRNLLMAMNDWNGLTAAEKHRTIAPSSKDIFRHPVVYMHGRNAFKMSATSVTQLQKYLNDSGGLLFADACCGSKDFDKSFRRLVEQLFPKKQLKQIPVTHELFSTKVGFNLNAKGKDAIKRRMPEAANVDAKLVTVVKEGPPILEGIEVGGRLVIIYSKYDLSCALERQASISCSGYLEKSAARIGINILTYALLQDVSYWKEAD